MIKMELVLLCLLTSFNYSFCSFQKTEGIKGDLTNKSKIIIDNFLQEEESLLLDSNLSVILMTFENNKKNQILVINDANKEVYGNLIDCIYTRYKNFLIIVDGIPDDLFFNTNIDESQLKEYLKKEKKANRRKYKKIEKGKYKGDIPIYSEYDPFLYYYISYSNGQIIETTPYYLKDKINNFNY